MIKRTKNKCNYFLFQFIKNWSLLLVYFVLTSGFSQQKDAISESKLKTLISNVSEQLNSSIADSLQMYSDLRRSVKLAKHGNQDNLLAQSYSNLAIWHNGSATIDSTVYFYNKAAAVYNSNSLSQLEAEIHLELEGVYNQIGDYENAMAEDFKALKLFETINDPIGIAKSYTRLCDILYYQEQYEDGSNYCEKAIEILKDLNAPAALGESYRFKASNQLMLDDNDEALNLINKSITAFKEAGDNDINLAKNYNTRGNIYKYMERYSEAITDYENCHDIAKKYNATGGIIASLANIGHVKILQEKHEEALPYTLEVIELMTKSGNTLNLRENYMHAANSYEALEDYKNALTYEKLYSNARIEELQQMISQLESELQIKYESAKKDETIETQDATINRQRKTQLLYIGIAILLGIILLGMYLTIRNIRKKRIELALLNTELAEKQDALESSNTQLKYSLDELKSTQAQLIHSEKMASLGELTAGIAHEIQNPLNFVNNFSEVSNELIDEMNEELDKGDIEEAKAISEDIKQNLEKINHHGKRADGIVKGMLQHSRPSGNIKEVTDINALADEYMRLAYHGLRAKDKSFNAHLETDFDDSINSINVIPQDIGRVILNLFTNAFYAVDERSQSAEDNYKPTVSVSTKKLKDRVVITVRDNGNGISQKYIDKIFQPFFTTKPTGKGTGLGLSMSYDIIKAHEGELKVETKEGEGSTFLIQLPTNS